MFSEGSSLTTVDADCAERDAGRVAVEEELDGEARGIVDEDVVALIGFGSSEGMCSMRRGEGPFLYVALREAVETNRHQISG